MQASLDCLTDGSEYTGGPAIFLTLRKFTESSEDEGSILARYNLTGLPSLTGRLSSDQSYQLLSGGCFRCILLPSLNNCGGLASLFLSLVHFGYKALSPTVDGHCSDSESSMENDTKLSTSYGDITIVGPQNTSVLVDGILDTLFGNNRKRPSIRLCEVPLDKSGCWWDVYQDSYVRIWAQSVDNNAKKRKRPGFSSCNHPRAAADDDSAVYLVMIKPYFQTKIDTSKCNSRPISFAILPRSETCTSRIWDTLRNLPQEVIGTNNHDHHLDFVIHLDPCRCSRCTKQIDSDVELTDTIRSPNQVSMLQVPEWTVTNKLSRYYIATFPDCQDIFDPGTLIRAQKRSLLLHTNLPFAFPLSGRSKYLLDDKHNTTDECRGNRNVDCFLKSCSSIPLNQTVSSQSPFVTISKREAIFNRCSINSDYEAKPTLDPNVVLSLRNAYYHCNEETAATDDNEINLDDCSASENDGELKRNLIKSLDSDQKFPNHTAPHLLLLGTGCATPSALRGSSSYALFLPTSIQTSVSEKTSQLVLSAIIECGEGTLTSLSRHLPQSASNHNQSLSLNEQLRWVRLIWISHSHLDHYGDLPSLISAIARSKSKSKNNDSSCPLVVVAPVKVLKFLRVMLQSSVKTASTKVNSIEHSSYIGITHREFQISPFASNIKTMLFDYALPIPPHEEYDHLSCELHMYHPFASIRNVEVEHCREAFALILELRLPLKNNDDDQQPFVLCFSGDTRPSDNLVHECRTHCFPQASSAHWQHAAIPPPPPPRVSLLLHEATFMNDEHGRLNAAKKLHSTTAEALEVARRMQAEACLLTHFSQRYTHVSIVDAACSGATPESNSSGPSSFPGATTNKHSFSWGVAVDGMMMPLTKQVTAMLHTLSLCVDELLSK